jgi:hypothetical protein
MKSFFYTSYGRFRATRLGAALYLLNSISAFIWGQSLAWGTGWLLEALAFFLMSLSDEIREQAQRWRSPTYLVGIATAIVGLWLLFNWQMPLAQMFVRPSFMLVIAVGVLSFTVGQMLRRGQ